MTLTPATPADADLIDMNACFRHYQATEAGKTAFSDLIAEEAAIFGSFCDVVTLKAGVSVFEAGSPDDSLYIVVDGSLSVAPPGSRPPSAPVGPGEVLGEAAFLHGQGPSVTATATVETRLLRCRRWRWADLQVLYPGVAAKIVWDLARSLAVRAQHTPPVVQAFAA